MTQLRNRKWCWALTYLHHVAKVWWRPWQTTSSPGTETRLRKRGIVGPCGTKAGSLFNLNAGVVWFQCEQDVSKRKQSLKLETVCRLFVPLCQETLAAKLQTSQLLSLQPPCKSPFVNPFQGKDHFISTFRDTLEENRGKNASSSATCPASIVSPESSVKLSVVHN